MVARYRHADGQAARVALAARLRVLLGSTQTELIRLVHDIAIAHVLGMGELFVLVPNQVRVLFATARTTTRVRAIRCRVLAIVDLRNLSRQIIVLVYEVYLFIESLPGTETKILV